MTKPIEPSSEHRTRVVARSLVVWLILIVAEIAHGMIRAILLVPRIGEFRSNQIGVFTGSAIILLIACLTIRWIGAKGTSQLLAVGGIWLVLTIGFEVFFGRFVMGLTWQRIGADYNVFRGGLMPFGLLVMLLSSVMAARIRRIGATHVGTEGCA